MRRAGLARLTALIVCATPTLAAQGPRAALEAIGEQSVVRVTVDGRRVQGRITRMDGDLLLLGNRDVTTRVNLGGIDSVWQRKRSFGAGVLIGGLFPRWDRKVP